MNVSKAAFAALTLLLCGLLVAESADARGPRSHVGVGIYVGVPLAGFGYYGYYPPPYYYPPYYYQPYYYYPPYHPAPVVIQQQPTVYVEQNPQPAPAAQPAAPAYWYFCADSRAYYPYVRECASGWQRVAPQPVDVKP